MNSSNKLFILLILILFFNISCVFNSGKGPAVAPFAPNQNETQTLYKQCPSGEGEIYIYRQGNLYKDLRALIQIDGSNYGFNIYNGYFCVALKPGEHSITSKLEWWNTLTVKEIRTSNKYHYRFYSRPKDSSEIHIKISNGQKIFIRLTGRGLKSFWGMLDPKEVSSEIGLREISNPLRSLQSQQPDFSEISKLRKLKN